MKRGVVMPQIQVLDCTLRDGGYCNGWNFGEKNIYKIIYDIRGFGMKTTEPTAGCGRFRGKVFYKKLINRFWRPRRAAEDLQRLF